MENDNRKHNESVFSRKIRAGRRRTYFFDVRTTRGNDFYLTITESKKRHDNDGYERHKIFLYKEDFNKFIEEMTASVDYIKERMPEFDFDAFSHKYEDKPQGEYERTEESSGSVTELQEEPKHDEQEEQEHDDEDMHQEDKNDSASEQNSADDDDDLKL